MKQATIIILIVIVIFVIVSFYTFYKDRQNQQTPQDNVIQPPVVEPSVRSLPKGTVDDIGTATVGSFITITIPSDQIASGFTVNGVPGYIVGQTDFTITGIIMTGSTSGRVLVQMNGKDAVDAGLIEIDPCLAPAMTQQGSVNIGTGAVGGQLGISSAVSQNGNTFVSSNPNDNSSRGAIMIFTRSGGIWTQDGAKLTHSGGIGTTITYGNGINTVAISGDGLTIAVGAPNDNTNVGATFVYRKTLGIWAQESKLIGTGGFTARQGQSVALSFDGNTVAIGGQLDVSGHGAVWVFTRTGTVWTQQGLKLVPTGQLGASNVGQSVALSLDGNTLAIGANQDNTTRGALYVYTRTNGIWTQDGPKLIGIGSQGVSQLGAGVALSGDGSILFGLAPIDDNSTCAVFVYDKIDGVWTQRGNKIPMVGAVSSPSYAGIRANTNGCTFIVGGPSDNAAGTSKGAIWKFSWDGTTWIQTKTVNPVPSEALSFWGRGVALSGDGTTLIVGSTGVLPTGGAYVYI